MMSCLRVGTWGFPGSGSLTPADPGGQPPGLRLWGSQPEPSQVYPTSGSPNLGTDLTLVLIPITRALPTARPGADSHLSGRRQSALTHGQGEGGGQGRVGEGAQARNLTPSSPIGLEGQGKVLPVALRVG